MSKKKSSRKHSDQSKKRKNKNNSYKSMIKTFVKKVHCAILNRNKEVAKISYVKAQSIIDRCAKKGIIHKNKASRYKSKLSSKISSLQKERSIKNI